MRIEETIRDYLAENLNFIADDLTLIKKEYYLPAVIGAKGYIDILAKDNLNNFVIIEIKRSEQAARQTINELLKYQGLLKQIYRAQAEEIKLIIISTSWNELIIPFSEIYDSVYLTGYKIDLNEENIPVSIKIQKPVEVLELERKISPSQSAELFYTKEKREEFIEIIGKKLKTLGIDDYVLVRLNSNGINNEIVFPFALYFAFQRQSMQRNYELIPDLNDELDDIEFDDEDHKLRYIDENIYLLLDTHKYNDSMEAGDPVKFTTIINSGQWDMESMVKNGIFSVDPRISDEQIISEIKGYDGENETRFLEYADSKNTKKLLRVQKNLKKSLQWNKKLFKHVDHILNMTISTQKSFMIVIEIFYPRSIFDAIWRFYATENPNYMPVYNILVIPDNLDVINHYHGELAWSGMEVKAKSILEQITAEDPFSTFMQCVHGSFDKKILRMMNLQFVNEVSEITNGEINDTRRIIKQKKEFITDNKEYSDMIEYFRANGDLMNGISYLYKQFTNV